MTPESVRGRAIEKAKQRRAQQLKTLNEHVQKHTARIEREYREALVSASKTHIRSSHEATKEVQT